MDIMPAGANEEGIRCSRRRPRTSMKGAGGILALGGAIIAAAFAAHRARTERRRGAAAAASTSSNAMPRVQQGEHSTALPGSGGVADGGLHGDGSLCGAAVADERKEQILLKADVETSDDFVFELEKADVMSHEDRTSRESDHCFVSTEHQIGEIKPEESELLLDGSKVSDVVNRAKEDSSSESSLNDHRKQMQVISDGFMMVQELEQDTLAAASHLSMPECYPELNHDETKSVHVTEMEDSQESEILLEGSELSDVVNRAKEDSSTESSVNETSKQIKVISDGFMMVKELDQDTSAAVSHFSMPQCYLELRVEETKAVRVTEIEENSQEPELLLDGSKFSDVANQAKEDSSFESSLNGPWKQMQVISGGFMMVQEMEQDTLAAASHFSIPQCHPDLKAEETKAVHVTEIEEGSQESELLLVGPKFSDAGNRKKEDSSSESSLNEHWKQMQVVSDGFMMVQELGQDISAAASHFSMPQCHPELKIEETKVHVTEIEDSQGSETLLDDSESSDVVKRAKEDSSSESSLNESWKQMQVITDGFMMVQELEQDTSPHLSMLQCHPELKIDETIVHVTEIDEDSQEESPVLTEPFKQVEDLSDEEESDVKDEGSDVSLVSSSSSSSGSSAEPIWPAEMIKQEKSVVSTDLVNDLSSELEIFEEVKDIVHSEDSGEVIKDTTLTKEAESEEIKSKANAIRRSGTIVVFKNNSKGFLPRRLLLLLLAMATALGLISLLDKEQLVTDHLIELCNKFFHAIFASSDNKYGF